MRRPKLSPPRWLKRSPSVDLYRALRSPSWEVALWRDYRESVRAWAPLRQRAPGKPPELLIYHWRDDIFEAKLFSMLGLAAGSQGVETLYAVSDWKFTRSIRLLRKLGPGRVHIARPTTAVLTEVDRALLTNGTYAEVLAWAADGVNLGRMVVSSAIRELRNTQPDQILENRHRITRLATRALTNLRSCRAMLDANPQLTHVVLNEPGYVETGPLCQLALQRGLDVVYPSLSARDDALLFKRYRGLQRNLSLPMSVDRSSFERAAEQPWTTDEDAQVEQAFTDRYGGRWSMTRTFQATTQTDESAVMHPRRRPGKPLAVIFCHVLWDATFWAGDDLFDDYADWLVQTIRAAIDIDGVDWVIKAHPANAFRNERGDVEGCGELRLVQERFERLPDHISIMLPSAPVTALDCYQKADIGITVRGMPGFEMACFGKRVLTAGTGPYDQLGFTDDHSSREAYLEALRGLPDAGGVPEERADRARRYALLLFRDRPFVLRSFRMDLSFTQGGAWTPLGRNLRPSGSDTSDLDALGRWLLHSEDPDWITPWHQ